MIAGPLAVSAHAATAASYGASKPSITEPPSGDRSSSWNEISRWLPQEARGARPEDMIANRYRRVGEGPIGSGSYGEVWKAYDQRLERWVALKIVRVPDEHARRAAIAEAKTLGGLRHPNIAQLLDAGDLDNRSCYLAMEFIDGDTLESRIGGPVVASVRLLRDAAMAVHHAHARDFIHRDLKPRNMMCERERSDHVYILDFGVARWMPSPRGDSALAPVGTFDYMAPEQATGDPVDARADIYGLATTLYHLIAGRIYPPLLKGDTWMTMTRKIVEDAGAPASSFNRDADAELDAILGKALSKRPEARYDSALAFANALSTWLGARTRPMPDLHDVDTDLVAGRYRLLRRLDEEGAGSAHLALDTRTAAEVVVKRQDNRSPEMRAMILRGAHIQSRANHPFIVPIFDFGDDSSGQPFTVMRWVRDAQTFDRVELDHKTKVRLVRDAAAAIHRVHELGYYRLDRKPGNALVSGHPPLIQLINFDLALHVDDPRDDDGLFVGAPGVMSPEQVGSGKPLDRRTDIFSLGATLYFALSGRYPLALESPDDDLGNVIDQLLENKLNDLRTVAPGVDAALRKIVMRCLAYDPADRFASMAALADALTDWLAAQGTID